MPDRRAVSRAKSRIGFPAPARPIEPHDAEATQSLDPKALRLPALPAVSDTVHPQQQLPLAFRSFGSLGNMMHERRRALQTRKVDHYDGQSIYSHDELIYELGGYLGGGAAGVYV